MLQNKTRNQHFLSQVEQRLNAMNPLAKADNLRIYAFGIADRDDYKLVLEKPNGNPIDRNLSLFDLFSFDVPGGSDLRRNFEALFHTYEADIQDLTTSLLAKLKAGSRDVGVEIIGVFAAKLLNFVRNPYSIVKVLNTFPDLGRYDPTNPLLLAERHRIVSGRKPHQAHLCAELGISDAQYVEWLRLLFMLLTPMAENRPNFFEEIIRALFEDRTKYIAAIVCDYDRDRCLLSDRGFSQAVADGPHLSFSFNLCGTAFVDYLFADPATLVQGQAAPEIIASAIASRERRPQPVNVTFLRNNLDMLRRYNRRVVDQCYKRVFCSAKDGLVF
ncbi:hypothetical protein QA648_36430 (plasmid) [Rhizobium sp. CB3171]|uniref:hypothetical protein n=1 Tax=Rhizobium sp. CB3171 TaxID=3039157 RepID=UPI0024B0ABB8|nr:hypothetical protein [Rhizobium sp. CB3171]WFU07499.1 hypothetical protein QA648_36430 [Rhizobium sp. CB3171]